MSRHRAEATAKDDESEADGSVAVEAAERAPHRTLKRRCPTHVVPPDDDAVTTEELTATGPSGEKCRRCTRKVADGPSNVCGWGAEALRAWRIRSSATAKAMEPSEPLKVNGAAPHDFTIGQWLDGEAHQIHITAEAFTEFTWAKT